MECDYDSDTGFTCKLTTKGNFNIDFNFNVTFGMSEPKKLFGNDDLLNGRVRLCVGPVVVVPVLGFSVNYQFYGGLNCHISYNKPFGTTYIFDGSNFTTEDDSGEPQFEAGAEVAATLSFPIVKVSLGFGLYTSDLSIRLEAYFQIDTKLTGAEAASKTNGEVNISLNPRLQSDFKIGFAIALVGKGVIVSTILEKLDKHLKERMAKYKTLKSRC